MKRLSNRSKRSSGSLTWWDTLTSDNKLLSLIFAVCTAASESHFLLRYIEQENGTLIDALLDGFCVGILLSIIIYPAYKVIERVVKKILKK